MKIQPTVCALLLFLAYSHHTFAEGAPASTLEALQQAGAEADPAAFLALLSTDAVFLGVDGTNRLQGQSLRSFVSEQFSRGEAWEYRSHGREIMLSADGEVAWFNETLAHDQLGHGWGSGVLIKTGAGWRVAQYNFSIVAPDNITASVAPINQQPANSEADISIDTASDTAAPDTLTTEPEKKKGCRRIRHKTNKVSRC